ncbi:MAG: aldo/keto reductase [Rhodobacteraceae bacterium]|nr:aldo/keto reductase [Paracoccaceae bacterium]
MKKLTSQDGTPMGRFAFGAMQFGGKADEPRSLAMYKACRAAGITHFDTAWIYTEGASETLLGAMIGDERDQLLIATKFGAVGGAGLANLQAQFDASRKRLGMDMVDVLYLHGFDPDTDPRVTMEGMATLHQAGHIRYIGLSNFAAWQVMHWVRVAAEFDLEIDIVQPMYNLVKRQAEVEILPMSADQNIAVAAYSPLGGGLLTGKYGVGTPEKYGVGTPEKYGVGTPGRLREDNRYARRYDQDWMYDVAGNLTVLARQHDVDPTTLAVAWVAAHQTSPIPIISGRTADQLRPSLAALTYELPADLYDRISALSPTPPLATDRSEEQS